MSLVLHYGTALPVTYLEDTDGALRVQVHSFCISTLQVSDHCNLATLTPLVLSCLVCNCCWLTVCIVIVVLCVLLLSYVYLLYYVGIAVFLL